MGLLLSIVILSNAAPGFAGEPECGDEAPPVSIDPIFKLELPASFYQAHFTEASQDLLARCGEKVSASAVYKYWLFADADTSEGRYIALGGDCTRRRR